MSARSQPMRGDAISAATSSEFDTQIDSTGAPKRVKLRHQERQDEIARANDWRAQPDASRPIMPAILCRQAIGAGRIGTKGLSARPERAFSKSSRGRASMASTSVAANVALPPLAQHRNGFHVHGDARPLVAMAVARSHQLA